MIQLWHEHFWPIWWLIVIAIIIGGQTISNVFKR